MKYKIYILQDNSLNVDNIVGFPIQLIEASFNWLDGNESKEQAQRLINAKGVNNVTYTILPYIYKES